MATVGPRRISSIDRPAADTSTSRWTRVGKASASSAPMKPPIELPITDVVSIPSSWHSASTVWA